MTSFRSLLPFHLQEFRDSIEPDLDPAHSVFTKAFAFQEFIILPFEPFVAKTFGGRILFCFHCLKKLLFLFWTCCSVIPIISTRPYAGGDSESFTFSLPLVILICLCFTFTVNRSSDHHFALSKEFLRCLLLFFLCPQSAQGIKELLEVAKKEVPMELWKFTPLVLKATAGLRLLPGEKAQKLLEKVLSLVFPFAFQKTCSC